MNNEVQVFCYFPLSRTTCGHCPRQDASLPDQCKLYTPLLKVEVLDPAIDRASLAMNVTHVSVQGTTCSAPANASA